MIAASFASLSSVQQEQAAEPVLLKQEETEVLKLVIAARHFFTCVWLVGVGMFTGLQEVLISFWHSSSILVRFFNWLEPSFVEFLLHASADLFPPPDSTSRWTIGSNNPFFPDFDP